MADCPHTIGVEFGTRIIEVTLLNNNTLYDIKNLFQVSGQKIKLQIWDTAGQERSWSITSKCSFPLILPHWLDQPSYFKGSELWRDPTTEAPLGLFLFTMSLEGKSCCSLFIYHGLILRSTYNHLSSWLTDARNLTNPNTVIFLIGNKSDLEAQV